jgi:hypothetical protein
MFTADYLDCMLNLGVGGKNICMITAGVLEGVMELHYLLQWQWMDGSADNESLIIEVMIGCKRMDGVLTAYLPRT